MNGFTNYWHQIEPAIRTDQRSQRLAERVLYQLWNFDPDQNAPDFDAWWKAIRPAVKSGIQHEVLVQSVLGFLFNFHGLSFAKPKGHGAQAAYEPKLRTIRSKCKKIQAGWSDETRAQRGWAAEFNGLQKMLEVIRIIRKQARDNEANKSRKRRQRMELQLIHGR